VDPKGSSSFGVCVCVCVCVCVFVYMIYIYVVYTVSSPYMLVFDDDYVFCYT